ncbi:MAG: helicase [Nitrosopumilus sp. H13]|nr:MAG: helicase [Nitrosopumilus sp. H13]
MSLLSCFPEWYSPRDIQRELISEIESRIKSGYTKIILCAPTGVGKSLIGTTFARHFESSFTVTASKHLQDQYIRDVPILKPVKGKTNFACLKLMSSEKVSDEALAMQKGLTCDQGLCQEKVTENGKEVVKTCSYKPKIADVENKIHDPGSCHYYLQKYEALTSPHSLWNYSAFFQILRYNRALFEPYLDRDVSIFDEAHKIENEVVRFVGYSAYAGQLRDCNLDPGMYNYSDIDSMIKLMDDLGYAYRKKRSDLKKDAPDNPDYMTLARLDRQITSAERARDDIKSDTDNYVIADPARDFGGDFKSVSISPVDVSAFVGEFFDTKYQLFMSATIDKPSFCENLGIDAEKVALVDSPRSPFPVEHRQVDILNVKRLSYGATQDDELEVIRKIDSILDDHSEHRGLILTSSVSRCFKILDGLSPKNSQRVRICHSKNRDGRTQNEILAEHASDPTGVLLSSSLWEGVDLKDDLSRFQIVAKIPYPPFTDKRIRAKKAKFPRWYTSQTLTKLLQGFGRSIRSDEDWARTYVLDGAIESLLRADHMIPKAYHDVLGIGNALAKGH